MRPETLTSIPEGPPGAARYLSEPIRRASRFQRVVFSWNVDSPVRGKLSLRLRVKAEGLRWSSWFSAGTWPPSVYRPSMRDPLYGKMRVDELQLYRPCGVLQYEARLKDGARLPRRVFVASSPLEARPSPGPPPSVSPLELPFFSQFSPRDLPDDAIRKAGACAPTSAAMVAAYYGLGVRPLDVARRCYDPLNAIYGNWPYLACAASTFGLEAWVTTMAGWEEIAHWLGQGVPPVLSLAWEEGDFPGAPIPRSSGHLLAVAGLCEDGVTCYDPAAPEAPVRYPWPEFGNVFWGHGGVAIIIRRP